MGQATVVMNMTTGAHKRIELICSTLQMAILMLFNEGGAQGLKLG